MRFDGSEWRLFFIQIFLKIWIKFKNRMRRHTVNMVMQNIPFRILSKTILALNEILMVAHVQTYMYRLP